METLVGFLSVLGMATRRRTISVSFVEADIATCFSQQRVFLLNYEEPSGNVALLQSDDTLYTPAPFGSQLTTSFCPCCRCGYKRWGNSCLQNVHPSFPWTPSVFALFSMIPFDVISHNFTAAAKEMDVKIHHSISLYFFFLFIICVLSVPFCPCSLYPLSPSLSLSLDLSAYSLFSLHWLKTPAV